MVAHMQNGVDYILAEFMSRVDNCKLSRDKNT